MGLVFLMISDARSVKQGSTTAPPRLAMRWLVAWWFVGLVTVGIAGLGYAWLVHLPAEGSAEVNFARDMSAHHAQAVEMALIMRERRALSNDLDSLTLDIVLTQQAQLGQMQGWLAVWGQPLAGAAPPVQGMGEIMGMATLKQLNNLRSMPDVEAETLFLQLMVRHHQGGVTMAGEVDSKTARPEVKRLVQAIMRSQESEMTTMIDLLARREARPFEPLVPMNHGQ
jgi:uncharacterized protein (DUF305 family)